MQRTGLHKCNALREKVFTSGHTNLNEQILNIHMTSITYARAKCGDICGHWVFYSNNFPAH